MLINDELRGLVLIPTIPKGSQISEGVDLEISAFPLGNTGQDIDAERLENLNQDFGGNLEIIPLHSGEGALRFIIVLHMRVFSLNELREASYTFLELVSIRLGITMQTVH